MATWVNLMSVIYPVGSIYLSTNSTSPSSIIGGTWSQITSRFLYCTTNTNTGGSNTHTLTIDQIPSHQHTNWTVLIWPQGQSSANYGGDGSASTWNYINNSGWDANPDQYGPGTTLSGNIGGQSHNDMPAYQGVYCWRRTA